MLSLEQVRKNIILKESISYFDWTASGLAYKGIEEEIQRILLTYSNTHSQYNNCAKITTNYYENAKLKIKEILGCNDDFYIIACGFGSTAAIKKFQEILGIYIPPKTKEILSDMGINLKDKSKFPLVIVGPYEHHSNEVSFRQGLCEVKRIPLAKDGTIHFGELDKVLKLNKNRKIIASFSAASNVTGIKTDILSLNKMIKKYGGILAIDASSLSPYEDVDTTLCDAIFISMHKFLGGVGGCGILLIKKEICQNEEPTFAGGGTVEYVNDKIARFVKNYEQLEEAGTPAITQLIRSYLAIRLRNDIGLDTINDVKNQNLLYFDEKLKELNNVVYYAANLKNRLPIFPFNVKGISPYEFAIYLSEKFGIQTRAGCACAGPYGHDLLGLKEPPLFKPGWVRASIHYTHTKDDIDYLINCIKETMKYFRVSF